MVNVEDWYKRTKDQYELGQWTDAELIYFMKLVNQWYDDIIKRKF